MANSSAGTKLGAASRLIAFITEPGTIRKFGNDCAISPISGGVTIRELKFKIMDSVADTCSGQRRLAALMAFFATRNQCHRSCNPSCSAVIGG
jgi:hypothetical protein